MNVILCIVFLSSTLWSCSATPELNINGRWEIIDAHFADSQSALILAASIIGSAKPKYINFKDQKVTVMSTDETVIEINQYTRNQDTLTFSSSKTPVLIRSTTDNDIKLLFNDGSWYRLKRVDGEGVNG